MHELHPVEKSIPTTGSCGSVVKLRNHSKPSVLIDLLKHYKTKVDVYAYDAHCQRTRINTNEFCRFLEEQGCTLALKIFRASFGKKSQSTPKDFFNNELSKASMVRSAIGNESFYTYTTYRFFNDSCGFAIRPAQGSKIKLSLQHKSDYKESNVEEIYIVLHEACAFSLDNLAQVTNKNDNKHENTINKNIDSNSCNSCIAKFDAQEMDQCINKILKVLHENGIVHKDIRSTNIVYCPFSYIRYKLVDYAFAANATVIPRLLVGSKAYMSPFYIAYLASNGIGSKIQQNKLVDSMMALYDKTHTELCRFYRVLIKGHLVSLRRSKQLDSHAYLELKNDEYGYMMTLFNIYTVVRDPVLLARATGMSMCTNTVFA